MEKSDSGSDKKSARMSMAVPAGNTVGLRGMFESQSSGSRPSVGNHRRSDSSEQQHGSSSPAKSPSLSPESSVGDVKSPQHRPLSPSSSVELVRPTPTASLARSLSPSSSTGSTGGTSKPASPQPRSPYGARPGFSSSGSLSGSGPPVPPPSRDSFTGSSGSPRMAPRPAADAPWARANNFSAPPGGFRFQGEPTALRKTPLGAKPSPKAGSFLLDPAALKSIVPAAVEPGQKPAVRAAVAAAAASGKPDPEAFEQLQAFLGLSVAGPSPTPRPADAASSPAPSKPAAASSTAPSKAGPSPRAVASPASSGAVASSSTSASPASNKTPSTAPAASSSGPVSSSPRKTAEAASSASGASSQHAVPPASQPSSSAPVSSPRRSDSVVSASETMRQESSRRVSPRGAEAKSAAAREAPPATETPTARAPPLPPSPASAAASSAPAASSARSSASASPAASAAAPAAAASISKSESVGLPSGALFEPDAKYRINYDDLEIEDLISQGSAGEVYLGYWFGVPVAIKKLFQLPPDQRHLVAREYSMLRDVNHPNIVQFLGLCDHSSGVYLVTEYVQHGDLFDLLVFSNKKIGWKTKVKIALQISQACTYLHSRKIIHRDLKSQNVLIGDNYNVKLCDLGLATVIENKRRLTMCGTNEWMAPEIAVADTYDHKVDVFSFGIVLVELITSRPPAKRHIDDSFAFNEQAFARAVPETCPDEFAQLVVDCTRFNAAQRPEFKEVASRLRALHASLPDDDD